MHDNGATEIEDWPVPSAEVRNELDRRLPEWPEAEAALQAPAGYT